MMDPIITFKHHGVMVKAFMDIAHLHTEHCMCFRGCAKFHPGEPTNCKKAQRLYELCVEEDIVTPVYECPDYERVA